MQFKTHLFFGLLFLNSVFGCATTKTENSDENDFEGNLSGECSDRADNDKDGLFDCEDPDCKGSPHCQDKGTSETMETGTEDTSKTDVPNDTQTTNTSEAQETDMGETNDTNTDMGGDTHTHVPTNTDSMIQETDFPPQETDSVSMGTGEPNDTATDTGAVTIDPADAARVSGYIDTLPWGPETLDAAGKREEFVDAVIRTCIEFAPPGSDEWQVWCQAFLVAAACRESSLDVEAIDNAADTNPTVGLLQIDLYFSVQDFYDYGNVEAIQRIGCEWPDFSNIDWDDGWAWVDWMQNVYCNIGLGAWYYFYAATGNGDPPCYIQSYCQGMGTPANLVVGMNSHLMGPAAAVFDPSDPYPNTYVSWIKEWFDGMVTPVPDPHPFLRELQPNPSQYCAQ